MQRILPFLIPAVFFFASEGILFVSDALRPLFIALAFLLPALLMVVWSLRFVTTLLLVELLMFGGVLFMLFALPRSDDAIPHYFLLAVAFCVWLALQERVHSSRGKPLGIHRIQSLVFLALFVMFSSLLAASGAPFFIFDRVSYLPFLEIAVLPWGAFLLILFACAVAVGLYVRLEAHNRAYAIGISIKHLAVYAAYGAFLLSQAFIVMTFWPFAPFAQAALLVALDWALAKLFIRRLRGTLRPLDIVMVSAAVGAVFGALLVRGPWLP